jgi:hypothetical protein
MTRYLIASGAMSIIGTMATAWSVFFGDRRDGLTYIAFGAGMTLFGYGIAKFTDFTDRYAIERQMAEMEANVHS